MHTNPSYTPQSTTVTPPAQVAEPISRKIKRTLWFVLCLAVIIAFYIVTDRSAWFRELPLALSLPGRVAVVAVILGTFASLNPWAPTERVRV